MRRSLETSYRTDLTGVRVHTGPVAHEVTRAAQATAMTSGSDIYFARDRYSPHTADGWRRVAHEVAHVVQQRNGPAQGPAVYATAETEARRSAARAYDGRGATISQQSGGLLQRDDGDATPAASSNYQLQLDPEIRRLALHYYFRWWISMTLTDGAPSVTPSTVEATTAPAEGETTVPPVLSPWQYQMPMRPDFFEPIDPAGIRPDMGAILAPYTARNVSLDTRDVNAATAIFERNYQFVSGLPDLRSIAPSFIRPLIPSTWRRGLAESFTAATLNAQLKGDFPTPIEAADLSFQRITGVSTTYIPIPGFSF